MRGTDNQKIGYLAVLRSRNIIPGARACNYAATESLEWQIESTGVSLSPPRYEPYVISGAFVAVWRDCQKHRYLALCPQCRRVIIYCAIPALYQDLVLSERQACQGCRAKITFERNPSMIGVFLHFWYTTATFPQSPSWLEAIPQCQCNIWLKEIKAGLKAGGAPRADLQKVPLQMKSSYQ
jgi:hypothetical protein